MTLPLTPPPVRVDADTRSTHAGNARLSLWTRRDRGETADMKDSTSTPGVRCTTLAGPRGHRGEPKTKKTQRSVHLIPNPKNTIPSSTHQYDCERRRYVAAPSWRSSFSLLQLPQVYRGEDGPHRRKSGDTGRNKQKTLTQLSPFFRVARMGRVK